MKRIKEIVDLVTSIDAITFNDLTLDAQVAIVFRMAQQSHQTITWWTTQAENDASSNEFRHRAEMEINLLNKALRTQLSFIDKAANYREATNIMVGYDQGSYNSEQGVLENDEIIDALTAVKSAPHAWARQQLLDKKILPGAFEATDEALIMTDVQRVVDRMAGQFIGRMIISLHRDDAYIPARSDARDIMLMGLSLKIVGLSSLPTRAGLLRAILELAMQHTPFIDTHAFTRKEISQYWRDLVERDEDDADVGEINADIKEAKHEIRQAIKTTRIMQAVSDGAAQLKASGASQAAIDTFMSTLSASLANKTAG